LAQGAEGWCWPRRANRKLLCVPFHPWSLHEPPLSGTSQSSAGLGASKQCCCQRSFREQGVRGFSQVYVWVGRWRVLWKCGWDPSHPFKRQAALCVCVGGRTGGPSPRVPTASSAGIFLFPRLGSFAQEDSPQSMAPTSRAQGGEAGQVQPWQRVCVWVGGHTKESRGRVWAGHAGPLLPPLRLGWDPPAVTISTSFCCVLYMDVFISCLTMLCSCGLSTSEETVF
jgi:hypothetical protein